MNRSTLVVFLVVSGGLGVGLYVPTLAAPASPRTSTPTQVQLTAAAPTCDRDRVVVIGHRGIGPGTRRLRGMAYSEDTIGSFRAALRAGADGFETDFWPTADREVVSHHDPTLTRMTDGTGPIWTRTADEVHRLRNDSHAPVPTFSEILQTMVPTHPDVHLQQEFKDGRLFSDALLRRFRDLAPDLPLGLIERTSGRPRLSTLPSWVDVVLIEFGAAYPAYVHQAAARGHQVSLRKVDTVAQLRAAVRMGVTRVVTDRPEVVGRAC